ncbi:MAG: carboxypeptidase-like regulatory domain-containing protein, partial [Bacteroidota bacterium]
AGDSPRYDRMCWKDLRVVTGTKATPGNACISGIVKNEMGRKISYDGYLYDQNRKYRQVAVDANGRFVISNLPDGTYELTVAAFQPFEGEEEEDLGKNSGDTLPTLPLGEVKSRFSVTNGVANPSELSLIIRRW